MKRALLALLIAAPAAAQQVGPLDTTALIEQLGARSWSVRERACAALAARGKAALTQLKTARDHRDPEVRWRVRRLLWGIAPLESYYGALALVESGQLRAAIAGISDILPALPKGTRPEPEWALRMISDASAQTPGGPPSLNRAIDWHNVMCLLIEAGVRCPKVMERTRAEYARLTGQVARADRLRAVVLWELGRRPEADAAWTKGDVEEGVSAWSLYDEAEWHAVRGRKREALAALSKSIAEDTDSAGEADRSSDFYMLRGDADFEALIAKHVGASKLPPPPRLPWRERHAPKPPARR